MYTQGVWDSLPGLRSGLEPKKQNTAVLRAMESFVNEKTPRNGLHFISSKIWNNLLFVRQASELFLCDLTSRNYATITSLKVDR